MGDRLSGLLRRRIRHRCGSGCRAPRDRGALPERVIPDQPPARRGLTSSRSNRVWPATTQVMPASRNAASLRAQFGEACGIASGRGPAVGEPAGLLAGRHGRECRQRAQTVAARAIERGHAVAEPQIIEARLLCGGRLVPQRRKIGAAVRADQMTGVHEQPERDAHADSPLHPATGGALPWIWMR